MTSHSKRDFILYMITAGCFGGIISHSLVNANWVPVFLAAIGVTATLYRQLVS